MEFEYVLFGFVIGFQLVIGLRAYLSHHKVTRERAVTEAAELAQRKSDLLARLGFPEN